jgi:hypothetical protein
MLPGFRFLFAAIMLSMSLLIFGLGAAALFRAAHESFASNSSWHATPDVPFAQRPDTTLPVLAALRIERLTAKPSDTPKVAAAGPAEAITEPMTNDRLAALPRVETPPAAIASPAEAPAPVVENPPASEAAPVAPVSTEAATVGEMKTAAVAVSDAASARSEPAAPLTTNSPGAPPTASAEPMAFAASTRTTPAAPTMLAPLAPEADDAAAKIATLGGPPVEVTDTNSVLEPGTVKIPRARPDESAIKRQQARRAARRHRLAARARFLALQQLQANPFTQPPFAQQPFAQAQQTFAATAALRQAAPRQ